MCWRQWFMVRLARRDAVGGGPVASELRGEQTLVTRHAVYVLRDGTCVDVRAPDGGHDHRAPALLGMRLVGFVPVEGAELAPTWRAGDCAVLLRAPVGDETGPTLAVTSPSRALVEGRLATRGAPSAPTLRSAARAP